MSCSSLTEHWGIEVNIVSPRLFYPTPFLSISSYLSSFFPPFLSFLSNPHLHARTVHASLWASLLGGFIIPRQCPKLAISFRVFNLIVRCCVCFKGTHGASGVAASVMFKPRAVTYSDHMWLDIVYHFRYCGSVVSMWPCQPSFLSLSLFPFLSPLPTHTQLLKLHHLLSFIYLI